MSIEIRHIDPTSPLGVSLMAGSIEEQMQRYGRDGGRTGEQLVRDGAMFVAALIEGEPAGCGAVVPLEPGVGELSRIFVHASARRRGVGSAILKWIEEYSRGQYERLVLETGVAQEESIALYEAHGFTSITCWGKSEFNPLSRCYEKWLKS